MARRVRQTSIESRSARLRLEARNAPYWVRLSPGIALGYRKGSSSGGSWIVKMRNAGSAARRQERLGAADDIIEADGTNILTFWQAQERSHEWFAHQNRLASDIGFPASHCYTVNDALTDYFQWFAHNRRSLYATRTVANARILPALGKVEVAILTAPRLRNG